MNLVQALQADAGILGLSNKRDELGHRRIQLTDDVLDGRHHTQRHVTPNHGRRRKERDDDVLGLVDEQTADFLRLTQGHALDADFEQLRLNTFPLPALLFFAVVELDLLHARDHLDQVALVGRCGLESHIIQLSATLEEEQHPGNVQGASQQEYQQDSPIVTGHDAAVNDEGNDGHDCAKQRFGQE